MNQTVPKHAASIVFLGLAIFLAYSVSLHGTWALDDSAVGRFLNIGNILGSRVGYREVAYLSFLVNKWINPLDPFNYRVMNVAIHLCNSVLVYVLAFLTLRLPGWRERYGPYSFPVALISSTVFALHPLNINAVAYIVQRMASLATMFVLLALLSYIGAKKADRRAFSVVFYSLTGLFVVLGIFSKENAVLAVPLILLYDWFFLAGSDKKGYLKRISLGFMCAVVLLLGVSFLLGFQTSLSSPFQKSGSPDA